MSVVPLILVVQHSSAKLELFFARKNPSYSPKLMRMCRVVKKNCDELLLNVKKLKCRSRKAVANAETTAW